MIKYVFLDLDNTVLDFDMAERLALTKALKALGVNPTEEIINRYHLANISQWKRLELGEITREEVKVNRYKILFEEFEIDASPEEATTLYEDFLARGHFFVDGAQELISTLSKEYKLYIASNGTFKVQEGRLKSSGILPFIEKVFVSEQLGAEKPNSLFFKKAFDSIDGFEKGRAVIIGDSLTSDIKGGKNAGIITVWFNRLAIKNESDIKPDYEICSLGEIPSLLKQL